MRIMPMVTTVFFVTFTICWLRNILQKILQKGVRRALLAFTIIILGWELDMGLQSLAKGVAPDLQRWLWYGQFAFRNLLTICIVGMASATGKPINQDKMTTWEKWLTCFHFIIGAVILSNDYHRQFIVDTTSFAYDNIHNKFGWFYYFVFVVEYLEIVFAIIWLLVKSWKDKIFRKAMITPLVIVLAFFIYRYLAVTGNISVAVLRPGVFYILGSMILIESFAWSGLLSTNVKYREFFKVSDLGLEIFDYAGNKVYAAEKFADSNKQDYEVLQKNIHKGTVTWYREIKSLKEKEHQLKQTLQAQERTYRMCKEQEVLRQQAIDYELREALYQELEKIMNCKKPLVNKYLGFLRNPTELTAAASSINRLNILACYLKKRCTLFLISLNTGYMESGNLYLAMADSRKYMAYEELDYLLQFELNCNLSTKVGLLLYDFHEEFLEGYLINGCLKVVSRVYETEGAYNLTFVFDEFEPWLEPWLDYVKWYLKLDQEIICKDLGYAYNITLSLPKGEVRS